MELYNEIQNMLSTMDTMLKTMKNRGRELAEKEHDYKIALRVEILKLRDDGQPATIVRDLCYGTPSIATKRLERDIADANYRAIQEAINVYKIKVRILENQLDREWSRAGSK